MSKHMALICVLLVSVLSFTACGTSNTTKGTVLGGAAGGVLGDQVGGTTATVAGTLLGALLGSQIGRSMDERDRIQSAQILETQQTGDTSNWTNPDTGTQYSLRPTRTYHSGDQPCREYTMNAVVEGQSERVNGTACRRSDGSWEIVN